MRSIEIRRKLLEELEIDDDYVMLKDHLIVQFRLSMKALQKEKAANIEEAIKDFKDGKTDDAKSKVLKEIGDRVKFQSMVMNVKDPEVFGGICQMVLEEIQGEFSQQVEMVNRLQVGDVPDRASTAGSLASRRKVVTDSSLAADTTGGYDTETGADLNDTTNDFNISVGGGNISAAGGNISVGGGDGVDFSVVNA